MKKVNIKNAGNLLLNAIGKIYPELRGEARRKLFHEIFKEFSNVREARRSIMVIVPVDTPVNKRNMLFDSFNTCLILKLYKDAKGAVQPDKHTQLMRQSANVPRIRIRAGVRKELMK